MPSRLVAAAAAVLWLGAAAGAAAGDPAGALPAAGALAPLSRVGRVERHTPESGPAPPRPEPLRAFSRFVDTRTIRYQPRHLLGREALPPGLEGVAGATPVFATTGPCDIERVEAVIAEYARVLDGAERSEVNGYRMLSGVDPALGPVTLAGS
jgi:hypothetical protein